MMRKRNLRLCLALLLSVLFVPRPSTATTGAVQHLFLAVQAAFGSLSFLVGFLGAGPEPWGKPASDETGDLGTGWDPWGRAASAGATDGRCSLDPWGCPPAQGDLVAGLDPDG